MSSSSHSPAGTGSDMPWESSEYEKACIVPAQLIPMAQIPTRLAELSAQPERHIVVHCHHGGRSLRVAQYLRAQGLPNVQSMAGGIDLWSQAIDPNVPRY